MWCLRGILASCLLAACGPIQPRLATDPNALAPPSATTSWASAEARAFPAGRPTLEAFSARSTAAPPAIQAGRVYDLPHLIDLAQQTNPETRAAWQGTRAAAARLGIAEGAYLPTLSAIGMASYSRLPDYDKMGPFLVRTRVLEPLLRLEWLLLDFGRRAADVDSAAQTLLAANLQFNRRQQSVIFDVQKAYFKFEASRARVAARRDGAEGCDRCGTGDRHPQRQRPRLDHRYAPRPPAGIAAAIRHYQCAPRRARRRGTACAGDRDLADLPAAACITLFPAAAGGTAGIRGFTASAGRVHPSGSSC